MDEDDSIDDNIHSFEEFYGCYLLCSQNPKFLERTYIGFTVNPNRRIKQHNTGRHAGGAKSTAGKGPWEMMLIVHGFPNQISALRFEWAWQNPGISRRLAHIPKKKSREPSLNFRIRVLLEMLKVGPWARLPLVLRWLTSLYPAPGNFLSQTPKHMPVVFGPVDKAKRTGVGPVGDVAAVVAKSEDCGLCGRLIGISRPLICPLPSCRTEFHLICLANHILDSSASVIPVEGPCPKCKTLLLWGELILERKLSKIPNSPTS